VIEEMERIGSFLRTTSEVANATSPSGDVGIAWQMPTSVRKCRPNALWSGRAGIGYMGHSATCYDANVGA